MRQPPAIGPTRGRWPQTSAWLVAGVAAVALAIGIVATARPAPDPGEFVHLVDQPLVALPKAGVRNGGPVLLVTSDARRGPVVAMPSRRPDAAIRLDDQAARAVLTWLPARRLTPTSRYSVLGGSRYTILGVVSAPQHGARIFDTETGRVVAAVDPVLDAIAAAGPDRFVAVGNDNRTRWWEILDELSGRPRPECPLERFVVADLATRSLRGVRVSGLDRGVGLIPVGMLDGRLVAQRLVSGEAKRSNCVPAGAVAVDLDTGAASLLASTGSVVHLSQQPPRVWLTTLDDASWPHEPDEGHTLLVDPSGTVTARAAAAGELAAVTARPRRVWLRDRRNDWLHILDPAGTLLTSYPAAMHTAPAAGGRVAYWGDGGMVRLASPDGPGSHDPAIRAPGGYGPGMTSPDGSILVLGEPGEGGTLELCDLTAATCRMVRVPFLAATIPLGFVADGRLADQQPPPPVLVTW
jgi:hypothetical protein